MLSQMGRADVPPPSAQDPNAGFLWTGEIPAQCDSQALRGLTFGSIFLDVKKISDVPIEEHAKFAQERSDILPQSLPIITAMSMIEEETVDEAQVAADQDRFELVTDDDITRPLRDYPCAKCGHINRASPPKTWYAVVRGLDVGVRQFWHNVKPWVVHPNEDFNLGGVKILSYRTKTEAEEVFSKAAENNEILVLDLATASRPLKKNKFP